MFQTQVTTQPVPGIPGTFCDKSPRAAVNAGPGGLVAGSALYAARFGWTSPPYDSDGAPTVANSFGAGPVAGFCMNLHDAVIMTPLTETSMQILPGFGCTLMKMGGFWVVNSGLTLATKGMFAYANYNNGLASFAAAGAGGAAAFTGAVAASTAAFTASLNNGLLNVTAVSSGVVAPGSTFTGAGVASGSMIQSQVSGTPGGIGVYLINFPEQAAIPSEAMTSTYGTLTVSAVGSGALGLGDNLGGGTSVAGTQITGLGTGTGGVGTYYVNNNTPVTSASLTGGSNVQTKWVAMSSGLPGEVVKMTSHTEG